MRKYRYHRAPRAGAYFQLSDCLCRRGGLLLLSALLFFSALFIQQQADPARAVRWILDHAAGRHRQSGRNHAALAEERSNDTFRAALTMPVTDWRWCWGSTWRRWGCSPSPWAACSSSPLRWR